MIATTTSNSIKVKPERLTLFIFILPECAIGVWNQIKGYIGEDEGRDVRVRPKHHVKRFPL